MLRTENIEGVIWDFDGVIRPYKNLTSTLPLFHRAAFAAFNEASRQKSIDPEISEEDGYLLAELSFNERKLSQAVFYEDFGADRHDLHMRVHRKLIEQRDDIMGTLPEFRDTFLKMRELKHIIVTQASCEWPHPNLSDIGLSDAFNHGVIGFETHAFAKKSESTAPFIHAAEILGLPYDRIAVIEDSMSNLKLPHAIGMQTALVKDNGAGEPYCHGDKDVAPFVDEAFETPVDFMRKLALA